jgi:GT2 family glycosyltransferase
MIGDRRTVGSVDVVVVSFNSAEHIRRCVERISQLDWTRVTVVDSASTDSTPDVIGDLPIEIVCLPSNQGFAVACNVGWLSGTSPVVLFLNPDAMIDPDSLQRLVHVLDTDERVGAVGPMLVGVDGSLQLSQRRFPRLTSAYAQVFALHRVLRRSSWASEDVYDEASYARPGAPDWLEGACLLVRRVALERIDGFDERFFLYCEDTDLCARLRTLGYDIRYEPEAVSVHLGQGSGDRLLPMLTTSRIRYAQKYFGAWRQLALRLALALRAATRILSVRGVRSGQLRSLRVALTPISGTSEELCRGDGTAVADRHRTGQ